MVHVQRKDHHVLALDDEASVALRASMIEIYLTRGQVVFSDGDPGDRLYVIMDGKIKLGTTSTDGRDNLSAVLTETNLLGLAHEALGPWLTGRPGVAEELLKAPARRLRKTNENLSDLVFSDVPVRVAKALVELNENLAKTDRRFLC